MKIRCGLVFLLAFLAVADARADELEDDMVDLRDAVIVQGPGNVPKTGSGGFLRSEIEARTGLRWVVQNEPPPDDGRAVIAIGKRTDDLAWTGPLIGKLEGDEIVKGLEGYRVEVDARRRWVVVLGNDDRGVLHGIGRLLRELRLDRGSARIPRGFRVATAPRARLRGHQLGYRAKTNSYDAWDAAQWRRYIRDLALFGTNAIELVPPRTDDDIDSPHFPLPPLRMMTEMSKICDNFDMDVWIWFPVMEAIDAEPSKIEPLLKEWDMVFRAMPRVDAVFIPGGDPGHVPPKPLFAFLEQAKQVLARTHPKAQFWVSPQGFDAAGMEEFLTLTRAEPAWLDGIVYGPQVRVFLPELRKALPAKYPIRGYPDITHSRQCQHPVPDWDLAFAVTEGRESINPRPLAQARLVKTYGPDTIGFISYSEGCNDDVNKIVWSAIGWDPDADVTEILRQYARVFLGDPQADAFAQALLALERHWSGPLLTNGEVETTLLQLEDMERAAPPALLRNWRFQQALYRANYDAYLRDRLIQESTLEHEALGELRAATRLGSDAAIERAASALNRSLTRPVSLDRRARVFELGEALFQSIGMQLSQPKYRAIAPERGANLDTIDTPLNGRVWLAKEFARIRALPDEPTRLAALAAIADRTDPGPGGFYDDLGDPTTSPHLARAPSTFEEPLFARAAFVGFTLREDLPVSWRRYMQTFWDAPILMRYEGLDPLARYKVRVVYAGDSPRGRMRLEADGTVVHDLLTKPDPVRPIEFPIPPHKTADGRLTLQWNVEPGRGGNGRGCQVAEVWLMRESP